MLFLWLHIEGIQIPGGVVAHGEVGHGHPPLDDAILVHVGGVVRVARLVVDDHHDEAAREADGHEQDGGQVEPLRRACLGGREGTIQLTVYVYV